jgi:formylglycine-generating enzyme required for sulfatase activity
VLVGDFAIGQHPVTVAEYACAVRAKAVRVPPEGYYVNTTWDQQLQRLDHAVVCVSWHDAVAYAAWIARVSGQPWRLPTEAEWEKMARWDAQAGSGGRARRYPWGDSFDKAKCNMSASGIGATTPVGRYPGGASPYGAQDVAGNVWEWTSSLYKSYAYNQNDGREDRNSTKSRVLRGGSCCVDARHARAAYRGGFRPAVGDGYYGVRLAVAPARAGSS